MRAQVWNYFGLSLIHIQSNCKQRGSNIYIHPSLITGAENSVMPFFSIQNWLELVLSLCQHKMICLTALIGLIIIQSSENVQATLWRSKIENLHMLGRSLGAISKQLQTQICSSNQYTDVSSLWLIFQTLAFTLRWEEIG